MSEKGTPPAIFLNFITNSSEYTTAETVIEHESTEKEIFSLCLKDLG